MTSRIEQDTTTTSNAGGLEVHRKAYMEKLFSQGYSAHSMRAYARTIDRFCAEFESCASGKQEVDGASIEALRQSVLIAIPESKRVGAKYQLSRFMDHLVKAGVVSLPVPPAKTPTETDRLRADYKYYLRVQRGLSEATIKSCVSFFERFMAFRFGTALGDLNAITPDDIFSFFRTLTNRQSRPYLGKSVPSHLRNLFTFLFWSGKTRCNLATSIPRIAHSQSANLPRYLKPDEIQRLIDAAWSDSAIGRRDYAIMLILARLGLRAVEVIAIQLEDIDWRAGEILIRGKGKLHDRMPLPDEVGRAIVEYIRNGRAGESRTLFVSERTPHEAFKDAQIINYILIKTLEKSGLKQPQKHIGSHLLRHSLATGMLGKGASLEEISHVLRHRSRATTTIYAKCDLGSLRSIAQAWPSEGGAQ